MVQVEWSLRKRSTWPRPGAAAQGFTLVEMLVVLLMSAVALSLAAPGLQNLLATHRLSAATNSFASAFHLARLAAIQRNRPVALCAGESGTCHSRASWDWAKGWIVFIDPNRNGVREADEPLLHSGAAAHSSLLARGNTPLRKSVIFTAQGFAEQPGGAFAAGRLRICAPMPLSNNARDLVLSKSGRLRLEDADFSGTCPPP